MSSDPWWPLIQEHTWEAVEIGFGLADFILKDEPWKQHAACRGRNTELFFPRQGQHTRKAKLICEVCVVKTSCDEYAERTQSEGVWGGELRTPKIRAVQDARPVRIVRSEGTGPHPAVEQPGFGTIASSLYLVQGPSTEGDSSPTNDGG